MYSFTECKFTCIRLHNESLHIFVYTMQVYMYSFTQCKFRCIRLYNVKFTCVYLNVSNIAYNLLSDISEPILPRTINDIPFQGI